MFARIWRYVEGPMLLLVPLCMGFMLYLGIAQAALLMLAMVVLVLAMFFAGYEASRPALRQIMPTLVLAALAAAGRILFGPIPDFQARFCHCYHRGRLFGRALGIYGRCAGGSHQQFLFWPGHVDAMADVRLGRGGLRGRIARPRWSL